MTGMNAVPIYLQITAKGRRLKGPENHQKSRLFLNPIQAITPEVQKQPKIVYND
jgi:hypothetical protein